MEFLSGHEYLILFVWMFANQLGVPVPSVPYVLAAGALAGMGQSNLVLLIGTAVLASLPADLLWYEIGRRRGMGVLKTVCRLSLEPDSCVRDTESRFARHGARSLLFAKFIPGMETVAPPLAGLFGMPRHRFVLFDGAGATLWSATFLGLGYIFHRQIDQLANVAARLQGWAFLVLALALGAYLGWKWVRRRRFLAELRIGRITPEELRAKLDAGEEIEIVDLRHSADFDARPFLIPGARHIEIEEFEAGTHQVRGDREVVLYCT